MNDTGKKDGPIMAGREVGTVAAPMGGDAKDTGKPEIDLASWASLGGKPSLDRRQKTAWRRHGGGK
jgi:hypothetical protein